MQQQIVSQIFFNWTPIPHTLLLESSFACVIYFLWCCHVPHTTITCNVTKMIQNIQKEKLSKLIHNGNSHFLLFLLVHHRIQNGSGSLLRIDSVV